LKSRDCLKIKKRLPFLLGLILFVSPSLTVFGQLSFQDERIENAQMQGQSPFVPKGVQPWPGVGAKTLDRYQIELTDNGDFSSVQDQDGFWTAPGSNLLAQWENSGNLDALDWWFQLTGGYRGTPNTEDQEFNYATTAFYRGPSEPLNGSEVQALGRVSLNLGPVYLALAKAPFQLGTGKHDCLHLCNNQEPFPMFSWGSADVADTFLGKFYYVGYLGKLEKNRKIAEPWFSGWRVGLYGKSGYEIGVSRSWFAGGQGQDNSFSHVVSDLYTTFYKTKNQDAALQEFRNQQIVLDFRLLWERWSIYGEWGREDHEHDRQGIYRNWDSTQANLFGAKVRGIWNEESFFVIERADNYQRARYPANAPWYNHHEYQNGWTHKGVILGHHMGTDAADLMMSLGTADSEFSWQVFLDAELHGVRVYAAEEREKRKQLGFAVELPFWGGQVYAKGWREEYENYGNEHGITRENHQFTLGYSFSR